MWLELRNLGLIRASCSPPLVVPAEELNTALAQVSISEPTPDMYDPNDEAPPAGRPEFSLVPTSATTVEKAARFALVQIKRNWRRWTQPSYATLSPAHHHRLPCRDF